MSFYDPEVIKPADSITSIDFSYRSIHLLNDELGIGTSTCLLWCGEFKHLAGTEIENLLKVCANFINKCLKHYF